ncbi:ABC transporter ATP-binding protein [Halonotius terrestris]|uniref:ABC transporter ATP-binding protein n=1 Tax=Halonotius terrestris TaxID=2487750 RepID=A0A8J8TDA1_9EURY|nr:ABC transporter ATP-binding protein [Halonotius terrestris]TQQ82861.1 ABC transporter ATP-binding protein [Halonotius terrestris]
MIAVENLTHTFGDTTAVDDVSLEIPDGEWVVLAGPNGSGKTTLVRHFNALLEPDAGEVRVNGTSATAQPVAARTNVGMVFQSPRDQFVGATIGADVAFGPENLGLDHDEIDRRVAGALAAVNLDGRREERIDSLSGGEQARVAIAGALAMEPDHLVLDEPFTGLDWPAQQSVLARLDDRYAEGMGIIVVTHDLRDLLSRADRIVGLQGGSIRFDLPPAAARERLSEIDVRTPS